MFKKAVLAIIIGLFVVVTAVSAAGEHKATGIINSIDKSTKTLSISHDPIKSMGMSAMTMDFLVADPAMLDEVKPGQKIKFVLKVDSNGRLVIVDLQ